MSNMKKLVLILALLGILALAIVGKVDSNIDKWDGNFVKILLETEYDPGLTLQAWADIRMKHFVALHRLRIACLWIAGISLLSVTTIAAMCRNSYWGNASHDGNDAIQSKDTGVL